MKKFLTSIMVAIIACLSLFSLFGCSDDKDIEGKFYLSSGNGSNNGPLCSIMKKDESGKYQYVIGESFDPKDYWVELKDGEMTVHGKITATASETNVVFDTLYDWSKTFKYTLKTSTKNEAWYSIYDGDEDTLYEVYQKGDRVSFEDGKQGSGLWYSLFYEIAK